MIGLNTDDMSYQMQFETLGTAPAGAMNTAHLATVPLTTDDDDDTDESTVDVILGSLPYGTSHHCRASKAQVRDCTEPPIVKFSVN